MYMYIHVQMYAKRVQYGPLPTKLVHHGPAIGLGEIERGHILLSEISWSPCQVKHTALCKREREEGDGRGGEGDSGREREGRERGRERERKRGRGEREGRGGERRRGSKAGEGGKKRRERKREGREGEIVGGRGNEM